MDSPKIMLSNICEELRMELNLVIVEKLLLMSLSCYFGQFPRCSSCKRTDRAICLCWFDNNAIVEHVLGQLVEAGGYSSE